MPTKQSNTGSRI